VSVSTPSLKPSSDLFSAALTDAREGACAPPCSLEIGRCGLGGDGKPCRIGPEAYCDHDVVSLDLISPN